jgi:hypothetical protein
MSRARIDQLRAHIDRQSGLLRQYEEQRDLSADPKEVERANRRVKEILASIQAYTLELEDLVGSGGSASTGTSARRRVLFLAAAPIDEVRLRTDKEAREIEEKVALAKHGSLIELRTVFAARVPDLTRAVVNFEPHVVHFSGHGASDGHLQLEGDDGGSHPVAADALAHLFGAARSVECVVLNACYSDVQARAISAHVGFVIGMSKAFSDQAALHYTVGFYQALGAGRPYDDAHDLAIAQLRLQGIPEHLTPVLHRGPPRERP